MSRWPPTTKKALFSGGTGMTLPDSTFFVSVGVLREGDDRDQPVVGELSESDRALLAVAGDRSAMRSGVVADTTGAYVLVVDSLPDSVYQYGRRRQR